MIQSRARCSLLVALTSCVLLAACGDPPPEPDPGSATAAKPAPKAADPGVNMVAAVSAGKSATAVGLHFSLASAPVVNTALPVDIAIIPHQDFTSLGARFESQEGLTLMSGDQLPTISSPGTEKAVKHQLRLMPVREGVYIVTGTVETEGTEGTVTRVFSIPVIVGATPAAPAPSPSPAPPGEGSSPPSGTPPAN